MRNCTIGLFVGVLWLAFIPSLKADNYSQQDPFGDSEYMDFVALGFGPVMFTGDLDEKFNPGGQLNFRLGFKIVERFSMVSSIGVGIANGNGSITEDRFYGDFTMNLQYRFVHRDSKAIPYIEGGFGLSGLSGTELVLPIGTGIDFRLWDSGTLGLAVYWQPMITEEGSSIPILLNFARWF